MPPRVTRASPRPFRRPRRPATNITIVLETGIYALDASTAAPLVIADASGVTKTITIQGGGTTATIIEPSRIAGWGSSIFEIEGTGALTVNIGELTIEDGIATSGGLLLGGKASLGGGVLIDGGNVALSQVALLHDAALGSPGIAGGGGKRKKPGTAAGAGQGAEGGGLYLAGGTLSLHGVTLQNDIAWGGRGGSGGVGGTDGGNGGTGGTGGSATGGGAFVAGGVVTGSGNQFLSDAAVGGTGGYGGHGGVAEVADRRRLLCAAVTSSTP